MVAPVSILVRSETRRPDERAMLAWLASSAVVMPDGGVRSWSNPAHPGYRYPEAAGLWLSLLAGRAPAERRDAVAHALARDAEPAGAVGRDGAAYLFDSAMALAGLLAHEAAGGALPDPALGERLFSSVARDLAARAAVRPAGERERERWSGRYGCHHLKLAMVLGRRHARTGDPRCRALAAQLVDDLGPLGEGGRFRIHERATVTYLHAACYAIEGLLAVDHWWRGALPSVQPAIEACAAWLAGAQADHGGLPAWHDGERGHGDCRSDVAAQAVRIWAAVDRRGFARPIDRALRFLAAAQHASGGLRYHPGSDDVNTWSTIFAAQAIEWATAGADPSQMI